MREVSLPLSAMAQPMTEPRPQPVSDPPQCPGCGYDLTGLARQGQCPECGRRYDVDIWAKFEKRPLFGLGYAFLPPLVVTMIWPMLAVVLFLGVCGALPFVFVGSLSWSWLAADRVAWWQYARTVAANVDNPSLRDPGRWVTRRRRIILAVQVPGLVVALASPWVAIWILDAMGYHVGWS